MIFFNPSIFLLVQDFAMTFSLTDRNLSIFMLYVLSSCQHVVLHGCSVNKPDEFFLSFFLFFSQSWGNLSPPSLRECDGTWVTGQTDWCDTMETWWRRFCRWGYTKHSLSSVKVPVRLKEDIPQMRLSLKKKKKEEAGNEWMFEHSRSNTEYTQSSFALTAVRMCDGSSPTTWVPRFLQSPDQLFRKCSAFMLFYFICVASEFSLVWHFLIYFSFLHWKKGKEMKRRESQDSGFTSRRVCTLKAGTHPLWAVLLFTAHHKIILPLLEL